MQDVFNSHIIKIYASQWNGLIKIAYRLPVDQTVTYVINFNSH